MKCGYCLRSNLEITTKRVVLFANKIDNGVEKNVCQSCLNYLRGHYRTVKK